MATSIYHRNISLQNKLDEINVKGTGNYIPKASRPTGHRTVTNSETKGSLHWSYKKREASKIDEENYKMAQRIIM